MTLEDKKSLRPGDIIKFIGVHKNRNTVLFIRKVNPACGFKGGVELNTDIGEKWIMVNPELYEIIERKTPFTDEEYKNLWI